MNHADDPREGDDDADDSVEFERLGRRAGAELRQPPPAGGPAAVLATTSRRRVAIVTTSVIAVSALIAAAVLVSRQREVEPTSTVPPAASSTSTSTAPRLPLEVAGPQHVELRGHKGLVTALDASSSADVVATGGADGTVRTWDAVTGAALTTVAVASDRDIDDVAVSPDGSSFAAHQTDGTSSYWSVADGTTVDPFPTRWDRIGAEPAASFPSPDGSMRIVTNTFNGAALVDATTGDEITTFPGSGRSYVAAWAHDGALVAVRFDSNVKVWRMDTFDELQIIETPDYQSTSEHLEFLPGDDRIAIAVEQVVIIEAVTPIAPTESPES